MTIAAEHTSATSLFTTAELQLALNWLNFHRGLNRLSKLFSYVMSIVFKSVNG